MGYRRYQEYKESGLDVLGRIPSHWETQRLHDIANLITSNVDKKSLDGQREVRLCNYVDVYKNKKINTSLEFMVATASNTEIKKFRLAPDDVIITKDSESPRDIGVPTLVTESAEDLLCGYHLTIIRPQEKISGSFLYYSLQALTGAYQFTSAANGVTRFGLTSQGTKNVRTCVPVLVEQIKIAEFLDYKTAQIDRLIEKKQELIEKLQEERVTIITQAVTRGLTPDTSLKDSDIEWLGKIPGHWQCAGFTKFISSQVDYRGKTPEKVQEGVFLVTAKNIKDGTINYELSKEYVRDDQYDEIMSRGKPEIGDLLFTTEAPLGEVANIDRTDIALAQRVIKFRGEAAQLDNYFARYWFMSSPFQDHLKSLATGSTALGIKASKLFALRIALPPLEEQIAIKSFLDKRLQTLAATEAKIIEAIETLQEYRTALITAAVTGQIDVRDWQVPEPRPEPATDKEVA